MVLGARATGLPLAFLVQVAFARWAGPEGYGIYSYALAWTTLLAVVARLGMPNAAVRFVAAYRAQQDWSRLRGFIQRSGQVVFATSTLLATLCTIGLFLVTGWRPPTHLEQGFLIGFWSLPLLGLMGLHVEVGRAYRQIATAYGLSQVLRPLLMLVAAFVIATAVGTLSGPAAVAVAGGSALPIWLVLRWRFRTSLPAALWQAPPTFDTRAWLRVALPLLWISSMMIVLNETDLLMIGFMLETEAVGFYKAATRAAAVASTVLTAVNTVAAPRFAALYAAGDEARLQALVARLAHWIFWPTLVVALALCLAAGVLLGLFGAPFVSARPALIVLVLGQLVNAGTGSVGYLLNMTGHQRQSARVFGWCALLNIVLNGLGIYYLGVIGAALATALCMVLWNVWLHHLVVRHLGLRPSILARLRASAASHENA